MPADPRIVADLAAHAASEATAAVKRARDLLPLREGLETESAILLHVATELLRRAALQTVCLDVLSTQGFGTPLPGVEDPRVVGVMRAYAMNFAAYPDQDAGAKAMVAELVRILSPNMKIRAEVVQRGA